MNLNSSTLCSHEHIFFLLQPGQRGYSAEKLSSTFSLATFGNGIAAIVAGLLASFVASHYGFVAPFVVRLNNIPFVVRTSERVADVLGRTQGLFNSFSQTALLFLVIATAIVVATWTENYGDSTINVGQTFTNAVIILKNGTKLSLLSTTRQPLFLFETNVLFYLTFKNGPTANASD